MKYIIIILLTIPAFLKAQETKPIPEPPVPPKPHVITGAIQEEEPDDTTKCGFDNIVLPPQPLKVPKKIQERTYYHSYECAPEASYIGGPEELMKALKKSIVYPDSAIDAGVEGNVYVEFIIDSTGAITKPKVLRGIGFGCDEAAVTAIRSLEKWNPGEIKGRAVNQRFILPVKFKLD